VDVEAIKAILREMQEKHRFYALPHTPGASRSFGCSCGLGIFHHTAQKATLDWLKHLEDVLVRQAKARPT
jgi:hypothetical protein